MSSNCAPIDVEYINPFVVSSVTVFRTMLGCELTRKALAVKQGPNPDHEISGIIGLSGEVIGTVVLSLGRSVALKATEVMLGESPGTEIGPDVIDAVGEMTNMIAGHAKTQLEHLGLNISLPNVIVGKNHSVAFPSGVVPIAIAFDCTWGPVCIDVGFAARERFSR